MKQIAKLICVVVVAIGVSVLGSTTSFAVGGGGGLGSEPPSYYRDDYDCRQPSYYYEDNPPACYLDPSAQDYPPYNSGRDYLVLGYDSGKALRLKAVSQNWLIEYMRTCVMNAPLNGRQDFRRGFVSGYGNGATSVLEEAIQDARQPEPQANTRPSGVPPGGLTTERSAP